jgi:hypothetical protein
MYMQPITAAKQAKKPRALALKVTAGAIALPFAIVVMVAYWAATALWLIAAGAVHSTKSAYDCLVFIGGEFVGH